MLKSKHQRWREGLPIRQVPKEAEMSASKDLVRDQVRKDPITNGEWENLLGHVAKEISRVESINYSRLQEQLGVLRSCFATHWVWSSGMEWKVPGKEQKELSLRCLLVGLKIKEPKTVGTRGRMELALLLPKAKWAIVKVGITYLGGYAFSIDSYELKEVELKEVLRRGFLPQVIFRSIAYFSYETTRRRQLLFHDAKRAYDSIFELGEALSVRNGQGVLPLGNRIQ